MNDCITIAHRLPSFCVTEDPQIRLCTDGSRMFRTKGDIVSDIENICPECGCEMHLHAYETVYLRDIPLLTVRHMLEVRYKRYRCKSCQFEIREDIPFKLKEHFITERCARLVLHYLSFGMTNKAVHRLLGLNVHLIKEIEKSHLKKLFDAAVLRPSRYIAIDEISIHSHHRYATVVIDLESGHVLFCEAGKKKDQVYNFIRFVGKKWLKGVVAVSMDMNAQYAPAFKEAAPHIDIVYDCFHMIKLYGDSVLTLMRRRLQKKALEDDDRTTYDTLKGGRFILLSTKQTIKEKDLKARKNNRQLSQEYESKGLDLPPGKRKRRIDNELRLKRLMEINRDLNTAYVLLEQFRLAYQVDDKDELQQGMELWCSVARKSKVPELIRFAQTIERHMEGITNHAKHPISSGKLEGVNNLAKVIKRNAYGFVDDEYFFLKLKQASRRPYYKPKSPRFLH